MSVMILDDPPANITSRPVMPLPRLVLRAAPDTLKRIGGLLDLLPMAGTPAGEFLPAVALAVTMITGGLAVDPDPGLPCGTWVVCADGRELARGTVEL